VRGGFDPGLALSAAPTTASSDTGAFVVEIRNATGALLARHPFDAISATDSGASVPYSTFAMLAPRPAGATLIELVGPTGTLARQTLAATPPTVRIDAPADGAVLDPGAVRVRWNATSGNATSWLSLSRDAGATWVPLAVATNATEADVPAAMLGPGESVVVRVISSDGALSGSADVRLRTTGTAPHGPIVSSTTPSTTTGATSATTATTPPSSGGGKGIPFPAPLAIVGVLAVVAALTSRRGCSSARGGSGPP